MANEYNSENVYWQLCGSYYNIWRSAAVCGVIPVYIMINIDGPLLVVAGGNRFDMNGKVNEQKGFEWWLARREVVAGNLGVGWGEQRKEPLVA